MRPKFRAKFLTGRAFPARALSLRAGGYAVFILPLTTLVLEYQPCFFPNCCPAAVAAPTAALATSDTPARRSLSARRLRVERLEDRQLLATISGQVFNDLNADGAQRTPASRARAAGRSTSMPTATANSTPAKPPRPRLPTAATVSTAWPQAPIPWPRSSSRAGSKRLQPEPLRLSSG